MITEDYVSFEVAKLLKEKGFDESTSMVYMSYGDLCKLNRYDSIRNSNYNDITKNYFEYTAPTPQMVMKWLREVYNIVISIFPTIETDVIVREDYNYTIYKNRTAIYQNSSLTYEQSCEESIKYTLENLI